MDWGGTRVLVTGARGFIGRHLAAALRARGASVHGTSRASHPDNDDQVRWWHCDLAIRSQVERTFLDVQPDYVFHLSSMADGRRDLSLVQPIFESETVAAVNVLASAAASRVRRVLMPGSLEEPRPGEAPSSPYAAAKAASRSYARMFHLLYRTPVVMTRIFMTYGPGQPEWKLIPETARGLMRGELPPVASPDRLVDWIYISDVVEGLLATMAAPGLEGGSVDIGSGHLIPIREVVDQLCRLISPDVVLDFTQASPRLHEQVTRANLAETTPLTGWSPKVGLAEGLSHTVAAMRPAS